jgi:hypothetical protein
MSANLSAAIHAAHDHLHHGRVDEAHQALHCGIEGVAPDTGNITTADADALNSFIHGFNVTAKRAGLMACTVVFIPSATEPGKASMQIGGNVEAIQQLRHLLGMGPTRAAKR